MENLRADVFLPLSEGHLMWTDARLERDTGFLLAKTRIQSVVKLAGFHGAAQVVLLNAHQEVLARSDMHTWGVDGVWISGTSDRTEVWSHSFDPDTARQATAVGVLHTWDPQWLSSINNTAYWIGVIWDAVKEWFESDDKGGGDTGGEDTTGWDQAGWPWTEAALYRTSSGHAPRVGYTIDVFTGSQDGAGTDANVYISLHGSRGSSPELQLENGSDNFERGRMDSFSLQLPELDEIQRVQIRHDNSGSKAGWFLDKIVVRRDDSKQEWSFGCGRWLAQDEEDRAIDRELIRA